MPHPVDIHVGKRIRHRRWMVGFTQQMLAEKVGIKFQQIQKYETGMNRVSASRLWQIGITLEVPIEFFFEGLEDGVSEQTAENVHDPYTDKEAMVLLRSYYKLPEAQRKTVYDMVRAIGDGAS